MIKIVAVGPEELDDESRVVRRLTELQVRLSKSRQVLFLDLTSQGIYASEEQKETLTFSLSPRAAEQLSDHLQSAVEEYRASL